jgi:hypothetical protein
VRASAVYTDVRSTPITVIAVRCSAGVAGIGIPASGGGDAIINSAGIKIIAVNVNIIATGRRIAVVSKACIAVITINCIMLA